MQRTPHLIYSSGLNLSNKKAHSCWNIDTTKKILGHNVCDENLLFVHAISGCDTTSHIFDIGKHVALMHFQNSLYFRQQAQIFNKDKVTKAKIIEAGESAVVHLYKGKRSEHLNSLRLQHFFDKVNSSTTCVQPHAIPPTSAAIKHHSLRVYMQVQEWKGTSEVLNPIDWGWIVFDGKLVPIQAEQEVAPQALLEVICCHCKTGCSTM